MGSLHAGLAVVAAVAVAVLLAASVAAALGWSRGRTWLDRAVLAETVAALVAAASGVGLLIGGPRPADSLHFLYGAVLGGFAITVRAIAGRRPTRRVGTWLVLGSLVLCGVLVRAFMTGG